MKIAVLDVNTLTLGDVDFSGIEALGEVTYYDVLPHEEIIPACTGMDVVLINKADFTREIIYGLTDLKFIGIFATGYNNIDLEAAAERGIPVANVPGYSTNSVSQHVFALMLEHASNVAVYNKSVHEGNWIYSKSFSYFSYPLSELAGKTLGIVGFGNIGRKVAEIGSAFGMRVIIYSRTKKDDCRFEQVSKERLFREADYLSLNCPLNEGSRNLVNSETLSLMKKTAFLINTSRGGIVDSSALAKALNEGTIAGAGIDVLPVEPMQKDEPLFTAKNCIITPHVAWAALETRNRCVAMVADNLRAWMRGEAKNIVNKI